MRILQFAPLAAATLALTFTAAGASSETSPRGQPAPPYVSRGDAVETHYRAYTDRLKRVFLSLKDAASRHAPDLAARLKPRPPEPVRSGYQILPHITPDPAEAEPRPGAPAPPPQSISYSWKRSRIFIDQEIPRLEEQEEKIKALAKLGPQERRNILERMVAEYPLLEDNQRLIDHHIQYNRFWQKAIHEDRDRFDRLTILHDLVAERESLRERERVNGPNPVTTARMGELDSRIHAEGIGKLHLPPFLRLRRPARHAWYFEIPVYTDVQDARFLKEFQSAVEGIWRYRESPSGDVRAKAAAPEFRVRIVLRRLSGAALYRKHGGGKKAPRPGDAIDPDSHVSLFPRDGAVLTTGAVSTYAIPNRHIALGPQDITVRTLAHEFGHILGFVDGYFRGYRDRGEEGYEVLEIVPDATDLMNNPNTGRVKLEHFEKMLELSGKRMEPGASPPARRRT